MTPEASPAHPSWADRLSRCLVTQSLVVFAVFVLLRPFALAAARLDFAEYFEPVLVVEALQRGPFLLVYGGLSLLLAVLFRRVGWPSIDREGRARTLMLIVSGILVWTFTTYDYNDLYDQSHGFDRVLLVLLWGALAYHPAAMPLLFGHLMVMASQMLFPLPMSGWYWPDKRLVIDVLFLFCCFLPVKAALGRRVSYRVWAFSVLCLVGATYLNAALAKMAIGPHPWSWVLENSLANLFVSSYLNGGWLAFLAAEGAVDVASFLSHLSLPMALITLVIEASAALLLLRRGLCRLLIVGFVLLHLGILMSSGIFFWKWILLDLALVWYLAPGAGAEEPADTPRPRIFGPALAAASIVVMLALPRLSDFVPFAWFDTKTANFFVFEGVADDGDRYSLHPRFFAPYDLLVQQSRFYYLFDDPVLVDTFGTTHDFALMKFLEEASPEEALEVRQRRGRVWRHEAAAESFATFVRRFARNSMTNGAHPLGILRFLRPPYHFQSQAGPATYAFQEDLSSIEIFFVHYLFTGEEILLLEKRPVLEVQVADPAP